MRGLEYAPVHAAVDRDRRREAAAGVRLQRLLDLPARGWWSGDLHVHMNYGGAYRADPAPSAFRRRRKTSTSSKT